MDHEEKENQRQAVFMRLFLDNIGGLIALLGVIVAAGVVLERVNNVKEVVTETRSEQRIMTRDVAEIKGSIAVHSNEIENLKRRNPP